MRWILAGDIGATRVRLGIFKVEGDSFHPFLERNFLSKNYKGIEDVLKEFLEGKPEITAGCLGIAAPITGDIIKLTNLPWMIHPRKIQKEFSIKRLEIINDLVANAYGIPMLRPNDLNVLNKGKIRYGNAALLSAGTGLGEAILFWDGKKYSPSPSEGGHVEFAPRNPLEFKFLKYLMKHFHHVSYERVLSGDGLFYIYQFLKEEKGFGEEPEWLSKKIAQGDPPAVISEVARLKRNRLCIKALDMFSSIYGAAAGNVALHVMALGGIYIGGGIAPKIIWKLKDGSFMKAFKDKGRYSDLLSQIPVRVIMNDRAGLLGAASRAFHLLKE